MNKLKIYFLLLIFISLTLVSCKKDKQDNEKPVIEIISPKNGDLFHTGEKIHFEANFSDNIELKEFKIDIHFDDGHDHKSILDGDDWDYNYVEELSGKNRSIHLDIDIPEGIHHGDYHFLAFCTDTEGNEAMISLDITIEGDHDK
jgi:hypothetical protein